MALIGVRIIKTRKTAATGGGYATALSGAGDTDEARYALEAAHASEADHAKSADNATEAAHSATSKDLDPDSPVRDEFLNKTKPDRTPYPLSVGGTLTAETGLHAGEYIAGSGGAAIDTAGNAEVESIVSRSYLKVRELIYNRLNAQEGDTTFADFGTIEQLTENEDGTLTAAIRRRWEGDFTALQSGDVVYGYVNDLDRADSPEYFKAWAWIRSIDRAANTVTLAIYPDAEVPAGVNHAPAEGMIIARWGNNIEPTAEAYANPDYAGSVIVKQGEKYVNIRQSTFFISCDDGNLVELMGVNKPILEPGNYGTVLGRIPDGLLDDDTAALINQDQPYLYARGILVQDLIRINYRGVTVRTPNFRGEWDADAAASETAFYRTADDMADVASRSGSLWQCVVGHASADEPSDSNPEWIRLTAKPAADWRIIPSVNVVYIRRDTLSTDTLECTVRHYGADGTTDYTSPEALDALGVKLMFSMDGVEYSEFWVRQGATIADLDLGDDSGSLDVGGNNVPWMEITDHIHLYVTDAVTDDVLTAYTVPVVRDGADGKSVRGDFTSVVFRRSDAELNIYDTPTGGTYDCPVPDGGLWTDGIPAGSGRLWACSRIFRGDGAASEWSEPRLMADTPDYDVEFSAQESPQLPSGHPNTAPGWVDPSEPGIDWTAMIWRAECRKRDGVWSSWTVMRIKGEKGDKGDRGDDGEPGAQGQPGPLLYPAGVFDPVAIYEATDLRRPYVADGRDGQGVTAYYALRAGHSYRGTDAPAGRQTPHEDYQHDDPAWELITGMRSVFAEILMADFARLASAVFSGDLMFSQQGTDAAGNPSDAYQLLGEGFTPNLLLDFLRGRLMCANADISGTIRARNGYFSGILRNDPIMLTPDNYNDYSKGVTWFGSEIDWDKCGSGIRLEGAQWPVAYVQLQLPDSFGYIGNTFRIENNSDEVFAWLLGNIHMGTVCDSNAEYTDRLRLDSNRGIFLTCALLPGAGARPGTDTDYDSRLKLMWVYRGIYRIDNSKP